MDHKKLNKWINNSCSFFVYYLTFLYCREFGANILLRPHCLTIKSKAFSLFLFFKLFIFVQIDPDANKQPSLPASSLQDSGQLSISDTKLSFWGLRQRNKTSKWGHSVVKKKEYIKRVKKYIHSFKNIFIHSKINSYSADSCNASFNF